VPSFAVELSKQQRQLIMEQVHQMQDEICECKSEDRFNRSDLYQIEEVWSQLIESNESIVKHLVDSLGRIAFLNRVFTPENDPMYLGYSMYMLKIFAEIGAKSKEPVDSKDIELILSILKDSYNVQIPPVVAKVLKNIDRLNVRNVAGKHELQILTKNRRPIEVDLTDPTLLGKQSGEDHILKKIKIGHGAKIQFSSKWSRNFSIKDAGQSFFEKRSELTDKEQTITDENSRRGIEYFNNEEYNQVGASPLYMKFSGIEIKGKFSGYNVSPKFVDAVVMPGTRNMYSFYLRSNIKAALGLYDKNVEVTM
jgi:hypothetical protein